MKKPRPWLIPTSLLAISLLAYGGMVSVEARFGALTAQLIEFVYWYGLAFAAYAGAILWLERRWGNRSRAGSRSPLGHSRLVRFGWLWGGGCLFRLILLLTTPTLSSDVYRYLWDGHLVVNGISPYAFHIDAPQLDWLDIPIRAQVNHPEMASPYMPVAHWFFAAVALVFPLKPLTIQIAAVLFDLTTALILARLLALARLPEHRLLLYLWNPLVIVEVVHSAHVDAWMVMLMMLAVFAVGRWPSALGGSGKPAQLTEATSPSFGAKRRLLAALSPTLLALATLTKLIPVLLAPIFWWRWSWGNRLLYGFLTVGLLLPSALRAGWGLTGELDGRGLFGAVRIYNKYWEFNGSLFYWLEKGFMASGAATYKDQARDFVLFVLFILLTWVWLRSSRARHDLRATLRWLAVPLAGYVLLTTTLHPWYLLALLPFVPLLTPGADESIKGWLWPLPWLWLSGTLALSYITYIDPNNLRELEWVRHWEWLPTLGLLGIALYWGAKGRPVRLRKPDCGMKRAGM